MAVSERICGDVLTAQMISQSTLRSNLHVMRAMYETPHIHLNGCTSQNLLPAGRPETTLTADIGSVEEVLLQKIFISKL